MRFIEIGVSDKIVAQETESNTVDSFSIEIIIETSGEKPAGLRESVLTEIENVIVVEIKNKTVKIG